MYGRREHELTDRMIDAASHLRLIAPVAIEELMRDADELARRYVQQDEPWRLEWLALRSRLRASFRHELCAVDDERRDDAT